MQDLVAEFCGSPLIGKKINATLEHYVHQMKDAESIDVLESGWRRARYYMSALKDAEALPLSVLRRIYSSLDNVYKI
ncbi:hypothetical protein [Pseudomonas sp. EpS/L25]|uniref:hypothetical protein n=1 Tax=Pseudomonas sp. EpS/L25 TaxID=1749078 RepID=UPI00128FB636|nr:hypothetical protein [Pseudomonas sp. EpS/L25]